MPGVKRELMLDPWGALSKKRQEKRDLRGGSRETERQRTQNPEKEHWSRMSRAAAGVRPEKSPVDSKKLKAAHAKSRQKSHCRW